MQTDHASNCDGTQTSDILPESTADGPLITVVTVVYNGAKEIERTIQSFLQQDRSDCEYVVIDGGSKDGTQEILRKHAASINICLSEPDNGIYDAMNKGLRRARGEWVYYLNCGDSLAGPDVLRKVYATLRQTRRSIVAGSVLVNRPGEPEARLPLAITQESSARQLFQAHLCHQALFVRRSAYCQRGGFNPTYRLFADFDICLKIISETGGFERIGLDIAYFDLSGATSSPRNSLRLYRESERIFSAQCEGRSRMSYILGAARAVAYRYKRLALSFRG
jgi:glycosyltransferase involved in cell wall biosynthesis